MKNKSLFTFINTCLVLSVCAGCNLSAATISPTRTQAVQSSLPFAAPTSIPVKVTDLPVIKTDIPITETPSPKPIPILSPTLTLSPNSTDPRGTLSLKQKFGFGTGLRFSPYGLQLSGDEKRLIAATSAGLFVYSAEDLNPLLSIPSPNLHPGYPSFRHIRISRDGSMAAAISLNTDYFPTIKFWDLVTGSLLGEYPLESKAGDDAMTIADLDISPDKTQVVLVSKNGFIQVVNVADGRILKTLAQYTNITQTPLWIEFDPLGKNAYYIFQDAAAGVQCFGLSSVSWQEVSSEVIDISDFPWNAGAFAPLLSQPAGFKWGYFTLRGNRTISAWDYSTFDHRFDIKRKDPISAIAFSPDSQWIVMGATNPAQLEVWAIDTIKAPQQTFAVTTPLWAVAVSSGGQTIYGISNDGNLSMWKSGHPGPIHQQRGFLPVASRLAYSEDGTGLQLSIANDQIYEITSQDGRLKDIHPNPDILAEMNGKIPVSTTISADKKLLAVLYFSTDDYAIRLFDLTTGKFIRKIPSKNWLESIEFAPDGLSIIAFSRNHPVQVLDIKTGKVLKEIAIHASLGTSLSEIRVSRDKSTLVLFGETGAIEIYRTASMELIQSLDAGPEIWSIGISDDGSLLAYYSLDGTLNSWNVTNGSPLPPIKLDLPKNVAETTSLAFSPDNHTLAFATWDGVIRMYAVAP